MPRIFEHLKNKFKTPCDRVVLELGAHNGEHTTKIYPCFPGNVKYLAFEPDIRNIPKVQQHALVKNSKVILLPVAVSSSSGIASFFMSGPTWSASSSILKPTGHLKKYPWITFPTQCAVETITLDDVAKKFNLNHVDFIWMDVQGAEHLVFIGGAEILKRTSWIYTEFSNVPLYNGQSGLETLLKLLPGRWEVVENYGEDVLLNNADFCRKSNKIAWDMKRSHIQKSNKITWNMKRI